MNFRQEQRKSKHCELIVNKFEETKNHLNIVKVLLISLGEVEENELESVEMDLLRVMPAGVRIFASHWKIK